MSWQYYLHSPCRKFLTTELQPVSINLYTGALHLKGKVEPLVTWITYIVQKHRI